MCVVESWEGAISVLTDMAFPSGDRLCASGGAGSTQMHWPFPGDRILEGYAYYLTHPGIPCIYWDHLWRDFDEIRRVPRPLAVQCTLPMPKLLLQWAEACAPRRSPLVTQRTASVPRSSDIVGQLGCSAFDVRCLLSHWLGSGCRLPVEAGFPFG
jgi:hypothetical protein